MEKKMLKCGCSAQGTHRNIHDDLPENHPSCVIHGCCEVIKSPDLTGRTAKCGSAKSFSRNNECSECAKTKSACSCKAPSSINLAFFEYCPDKEYDKYYCGCIGWD